MGFLDALFDMFSSEINRVEKRMGNIEKETSSLRDLDDRSLIEKYRNETDTDKKIAEARVLKERGYGNK